MRYSVGALVLVLAACEPKTIPPATDAGVPTAIAVQRLDAAVVAAVDASRVDPQDVARTYNAAETIVGSILVAGHAMNHLRDLTEAYGPRVSGTKVHADAAAWAVEAFKRFGIESLRVEEFEMAHAWERREARARVLTPAPRTIHAAAAGWFPGTPEGGFRAELVYPKDLDAAALAEHAGDVRGKLVLVDKATKVKDGKYVLAGALDALKDAGALAVLNVQGAPSNVNAAHAALLYRDLVGPLPMIDVGLEDGIALRRLLDKGQVTLEIANASVVGGPSRVPNVVAEIRGRELPDDWVLVGAHLDSWDFATGAQDNGTGVAMVLEAARAIAALDTVPRRSIRFALWGGEEQGLLGSRAYVDAHRAELDRAVLVLNTDHGAGAPRGWFTQGREDLKAAIGTLAVLLEGVGGDAVATKMDCGSDHCPFALAGVPALELDVDDTKYDEIHHLPSDTIDKVNASQLARGAAVVAVTAWAAADLPERLAARIGHEEVAEHLKKASLDVPLSAAGIWKP